MKRIALVLLSFCIALLANAQNASKAKTLKKVMELEMPGDGGSNGAAVVYHPITKKYYIPMVGNAIYPFATFDAKGKLLKEQETGFDLRGLWYNPKTKNIEGNCYNDEGWVMYALMPDGKLLGDVIKTGLNQPTDQSVGVYNSKENKVYFLSVTGVSVYNINGEEEKTFELKLSKNADPLLFDEENLTYNLTSLIYTGIPKAEIGLLNIEDKKIELFDSKTGIKTTEWQLPSSHNATLQQRFNFAYSNGMIWLFDKENRKWVVYK